MTACASAARSTSSGSLGRRCGPAGARLFQVKSLPKDGTRRLFVMGFLTNLLNPKIALLYLSLLPQFISADHGSVLAQSLMLGFVQIVIGVSINGLIAMSAGTIAVFLARRPTWLSIQRYLMGLVLAGLAVRIATEAQR